MQSLKHYWKRLFSGTGHSDEAASEQLEREIQALSNESHAHAEDVQRLRSDFEHTRDEENRKIASLEQVRKSIEGARDKDHRKLAELESINQALQAARDTDSRKLLALEQRLAGLEAERNELRGQVKALGDTVAETASGLEDTNGKVKQLRDSTTEQVRNFGMSLQEAGSRLDSADGHIQQLEGRLENERKDYLTILQQLQGSISKQDTRVSWTMAAAGFALLLGATAGGILIWDVQKNAATLSGMSADIKELMTSVNGLRQKERAQSFDTRQQAMPAPAAVPESDPTESAVPEDVAVEKPEPATEPAGATISKNTTNPYFLSSALKGGRAKQTEGLKQKTRSEADKFFEENAKLDGVVTLSSGVQYRVVQQGSGKSPQSSDRVVIKYVGMTLDGNIFDETYTTDEAVTYSMNELQPGWREVLLKMEEGSEFELYIPGNLTASGNVRKRGMLGYEPNIYLVELLEVLGDGMSALP